MGAICGSGHPITAYQDSLCPRWQMGPPYAPALQFIQHIGSLVEDRRVVCVPIPVYLQMSMAQPPRLPVPYSHCTDGLSAALRDAAFHVSLYPHALKKRFYGRPPAHTSSSSRAMSARAQMTRHENRGQTAGRCRVQRPHQRRRPLKTQRSVCGAIWRHAAPGGFSTLDRLA